MLSSPFFEPRAPFTFEFLWFVSLLFLSWAFLPRWLGAGHEWVSLALDLLLLSRPPRSLLHHEPHPRHPLWVRKTRTDNSRVFPSRDFVRVGLPPPSPSAVLYPLWQSDQRAFHFNSFISSSNWIETMGKLDNHVLNCLWTLYFHLALKQNVGAKQPSCSTDWWTPLASAFYSPGWRLLASLFVHVRFLVS